MQTKTLLAALGLLASVAAPVSALITAEDLGVTVPSIGEPPEAPKTKTVYQSLRDFAGLSDCDNGFVVSHDIDDPTSACANGDVYSTTDVGDLLPETPDV